MSAANLLLALDLGTTTLAGRLLGPDGQMVAEGQVWNPQAEAGADVIRRLEAALAGEGERLQRLLAGGTEELIGALLRRAGRPRSAIAAAAAAANPAVTYLLRRFPPGEILFPPHRPKNGQGGLVAPAILGLDLPVPLYLFPLVSGYVGGDLVAFVYGFDHPSPVTPLRRHESQILNYSSPLTPHPSRFFLDIGTNGEMALFAGGKWWVTSVAAGPAFEGGGAACGMPALAGAVEGVEIAGDRLRLRTVGGAPPRGICGSGQAALIAAALEGGLIDREGTLSDPSQVPTNLAGYLIETPAGRALRLYRDATADLILTQEEIRRFQLAKGAVRAGAECLLQRAAVAAGEVGEVVVTGAFGLSLPKEVLKRVAMLPDGMIDKVRFTPGGALAGVSRFLQEPDGGARVQALADVLRPYPLSGTPAFEKAFLRGLNF